MRGVSAVLGHNMKEIETWLKEITGQVDPVIKTLLSQGVMKETRELLLYQIETGGKRLRPTLAVLSCFACGGKVKDVLYPAAALEILHTYSLIIDDIIDHSELRRGKATVWKKFGRSFAECAGVDYGASLLQAAARSSNPGAVAQILGTSMKEVVDGEILDIFFEQGGREDDPFARKYRRREMSLKDYLYMVGKKSASLFQTACELGGVAANATKKEISALQKYGWHLGIALQITDDILDIYGQEAFGKPIGQDIRERKLGNILILFALKELSAKEQKFIKQVLKKNSVSEADVRAVTARIKHTKAQIKAMQLAQAHITKAKKSLSSLRVSTSRAALEGVGDFLLHRKT